MTPVQCSLSLFTCCVLVLSLSACDAKDNIAQSKSPAQPSAGVNKLASTVSAELIRAALRSPDEDVSQTLLGTLGIKSSDDSTNTPGKIFLNGELIYTARSEEAHPDSRGKPFNLQAISFDTNNKNYPEFRITKMVVEERSDTCQHIVLDFTGPKVWISERFPKDAGSRGGECLELTWVEWQKNIGIFYFGDEYHLCDKEGYHGWTAAYNPKFKKIMEPVYVPPPPKHCSLVPKPTNPAFRDAGEPTCEEDK